MFKRNFQQQAEFQQGMQAEEQKFSNIQDVYADNLQEEMDKIVQIVEDYPFVAIGLLFSF